MNNKILKKKYDFAVVGGGLSGLCAAVAAARKGVRTALIHARPVLGGNASSEIRMHICGADDNGHKPNLTEGGIIHEILLKNKSRNPYFSYAVWDAVLYETAKNEPLLTLYMNTVMTDCICENDMIRSIKCFGMTTEYSIEIEADIFADCTGNATLGYFAGAEYREGSEAKSEFNERHAPEKANNERMGNTVLFKAAKRDKPVPFTPPPFAKTLTEEQLKYRLHSKYHTVDFSSSENPEAYTRSASGSIKNVDYGYWWMELMGKGDDFIGQYEEIKDDLFAYVWGMWDHIKNGGEHGAEYYDLEWVGALPGMRESRRLVGDYMLNENDIFENRIFDDAVAYGGWPIDIHCPNGLLDFDRLPSEIIPFDGTYTIPWRSYYSKNIKNMVMAGRNISTSRIALGSTRIMGTCAIGGEAVGLGVSLCKKYNCLPCELAPHIGELQQMIIEDDGYIPGFSNTDENDLAKRAKITASSYKNGFEPENVIKGTSRPHETGDNAWHSDGIGNGGEWIDLSLESPQKISRVQLTFDSGFGHAIKITLSDSRRGEQREGVPEELVKSLNISLMLHGKVVSSKRIENNSARLCRADFDNILCDSVKISFDETHGCREIRVFEIRLK